MSNDDFHIRKRKTDSSLNMGNVWSNLMGKKPRTDDAKTPASPKTAGKDDAKADQKPSPSKPVDGVEVKAEETPGSPKIVEGGDVKASEPSSAKKPQKTGSSSSVDDGCPPALSRQDEGPEEDIQLEDTCSPVASPVKEEEKAGSEELSLDDTQCSSVASPVKEEEQAESEELPLDDTPECSPVASPAKKEEKQKAEKADEAKDEDKKEEEEDENGVKVLKVVQKQSSSSSLRDRRRKKTMADFGYHFKDGKLRTIEGDKGFTFTTQKEYEELGDAIGEVVYDLMEAEGLERRYFEVGRNRRFYFASPGYETKTRILVLIHGSGVVKAGQWARKLIINESLERGTQLEYIKRGLANGWGVVVLNYNEKCVGSEERCHAPDAHGGAEWAHAMDAAGDEAEVVVVAHSYGGSVISDAVRRMHRADDGRVLLVALTDSWFSEGKEVYAVNWNTIKKKLHRSSGTWQMYSGDNTHEGTSAACINSCFALLEGVSGETEMNEFIELLEESEDIIREDVMERIRKKREEREGQGDTASMKSLELAETQESRERKEAKKAKEAEKEVKEKEEDEFTEKKAAGDIVEKKDEKKEVKEEEDDEKKAKGDEEEVKKEEEAAPLAERNPSDAEEDSDEGVEKDAPSPDRKSDAEN